MRIKPTANTCITKNGNKYIYSYIFIKKFKQFKTFLRILSNENGKMVTHTYVYT